MTKIRITKKTMDIIKRDRNVMFTTTREHYPFVAKSGRGDFAYDAEGNKFIDFSSFISIYNFGVNGNAAIRNAIKKQVDELMHSAFTDYYAELPVEFAENLVKMMPKGFGRVFLSNSGTEANEDAIKLSRLFTRKSYIMGFFNAFHGRSIGALGLTSTKIAQRERFGPFPNVVHAVYPNPYRCEFGTDNAEDCANASIDYIERNIFQRTYSAKEIAAIFIEPVQGEGGYIVPPVKFMRELRKLATDNGILLVSDEVQSGYMRTGKFLAMEHFGVTADIYTMAKAIGGGLPLGATIAKKELGDTPPGSHAGTFGGNLAVIAAANTSLKYVMKNRRKIESTVKKNGRKIMKRLEQMKDSYEIVGDVRGIGMMTALELVKDKENKVPAVKEREAVLEECFYNGLIALPAGESTIRIIPPITIGENNLDRGLNILEDAIKKVNGQGKSRVD